MPETTTRLTKVRVLKDVPADDTYTDVRYFEDTGSQQAFFEGFVKHTYENAAYQRVNDQVAPYRELLTLRIPAVADDVYDCNYIMFQNQPYGQKWFYAFIRKVNFVSPNCTKIDYEIDWFQTYMCDFEIHPCMVLREHLSAAEDKPFANTVPEPIQVTKYTLDTANIYEWQISNGLPGGSWITVAIIPNTLIVGIIEGIGFPVVSKGALYGGIYNGAWYLSCPALTATTLIPTLIEALAAVDCAEQICNIFMTPCTPTVGTASFDVDVTTDIDTTNETFTVVDGTYTIRNKKLLSYPFTYIEGSSDSGDSVVYKPELAGEGNFSGRANILAINTFGMRFTPNYMGSRACPDNALTYTCTVNCTWAGQSYEQATIANATRFLTRTATGMISGGVMGAMTNAGDAEKGGAAVGAAAGAVGAGLSSLSQFINDTVNGAFEGPVQHFNPPGSDALAYSIGLRGFWFKRYCPTAENLQRLDQFFDLFGYAVNTCKMPNLKTRAKWNYVQLQKPCITGSVPVQGMDAIKAAFARGVRLWHVDEIGQYNGPGDNPAQ